MSPLANSTSSCRAPAKSTVSSYVLVVSMCVISYTSDQVFITRSSIICCHSDVDTMNENSLGKLATSPSSTVISPIEDSSAEVMFAIHLAAKQRLPNEL